MSSLFAYIFAPGDMWIILIVALLLFGNRLPSVMRSLGKGVTEFKKGLEGVEDESGKDAKKDEAEEGGAAAADMTILPLAFFDSFLSPSTMLILLVVAVLLYGERLPEVAKSWGKQFMDLKKSFQGLRDQFDSVTRDITTSVDMPASREDWTADREEATAPKFEPPPSDAVPAVGPREPAPVAF